MHNTTLQCNAQWKKKGGGGGGLAGRGGGGGVRGGEWQTATGRININVVSSWVLMSATHSHLKKKYKWAERKNEEGERCKILSVKNTTISNTNSDSIKTTIRTHG